MSSDLRTVVRITVSLALAIGALYQHPGIFRLNACKCFLMFMPRPWSIVHAMAHVPETVEFAAAGP
jgi:hypothetical protein